MAIVKANYVKRGREAKNRAKATIRYNQQRPGEQGAKLTRELFGADGPLTRDEVLRMIDDAAKGALFYRIVISPDPRKEDSGRDMDMKELTLQAMANLEERLKTKVFYAAVVHADHAPHRHVHVLAILSSKLRQSDLYALRQAATRISLLQRQIRDLASDRSLHTKHNLNLKSKHPKHSVNRGVVVRQNHKGGVSLAPPRMGVACPRRCGGYGQTMDRLSSRIYRCPSCGIIARKVGTELTIKENRIKLKPILMKDNKSKRPKRIRKSRINLNTWLLYMVVFINQLQSLFSRDNKLHNSRFAKLSEMLALYGAAEDHETSLLLGVGHMNHMIRVRPKSARPELGNLLVVAPTRGGKGLLAVSQLLSWRHSVVVNDIKGDLFTQTAGYRSTLGPVLVIDPTGVGNRYDPLSGKHTEDELLSSATQLLHKSDEGDGAIFTQRATVMLTQMFLAADRERTSAFPYVRTLIRDGLVATAARLDSIDPELSTQFLNVDYEHANLSDRFLTSAWGTLDTRMRPLLTETVIRSLSGADFKAGELMCGVKPVTIYLRWPERDLLALAPLVRLIWGSLIDELISTFDRKQGSGCSPVLLLVDEAGRTSIPMLADQATTVVGRKIYLWISVQSLSQLETVYGRARAMVLRENMESQIYYRPADLQTAKYLEDRLGTRSAFARSKTTHGHDTTSEGLAERPISLLTAQAITQMKDTDIIGFHRHFPPFRAKRMDWRRFGLFTERHGIHAPDMPALPKLGSMPTTVWQRGRGVRGFIDPDKLSAG